jgi:hypothetical protein
LLIHRQFGANINAAELKTSCEFDFFVRRFFSNFVTPFAAMRGAVCVDKRSFQHPENPLSESIFFLFEECRKTVEWYGIIV